MFIPQLSSFLLHSSHPSHIFPKAGNGSRGNSGSRCPPVNDYRRRTTSIKRVSIGQYHCAIYTAELHYSDRRGVRSRKRRITPVTKIVPLFVSSDPMSNICSTEEDIFTVKMAEAHATLETRQSQCLMQARLRLFALANQTSSESSWIFSSLLTGERWPLKAYDWNREMTWNGC